MKICNVVNCSKPSRSRDMCVGHYTRWRKSGDPLVCGRPHGKHGLSRSPEYRAWKAMIQRCHNPKDRAFACYGRRGIEVCVEWRTSFERFHQDLGSRPSDNHSLDRYPDMNGNYEPSNCRWATKQQQEWNKRTNHPLTIDGVTRTVTEWAIVSGIGRPTIFGRLRRGVPARDAVFGAPDKSNINRWRKSVISERFL
jgi:hypothetical protein